MKNNNGPCTTLRPRPITHDAPLRIFWGSTAPGDAVDPQDTDTKITTRYEPIPAWKVVKSYKSETKRGFTLPTKYIHVLTFDDSCVEYELDDDDDAFLEKLASQKFSTQNGNNFIISPSLVRVTIDYLEKYAFRQEGQNNHYRVEGNELRKKIEQINGCVLPAPVYLKICSYWKKKRSMNSDQPLIEILAEEEDRRRELNAEATKQRVKTLEAEYDDLWELRREMERIRMLMDTIKKREKIKTLISDGLLKSVKEQLRGTQQTRSALKTKRSTLDLTEEEDDEDMPVTKKTKITRTTETTKITKTTKTTKTTITKKTVRR